MGILSRALRRAASSFSHPVDRMALNYDLALERGVNQQAKEHLLRAPRFKEWGLYADEGGAMGPRIPGTRHSVSLGDQPASQSTVFMHHTHPIKKADAAAGQISALSPSDFTVMNRDGLDAMFAHEVLGGGSYAASRGGRIGITGLPATREMHTRARASLVASGMPEEQAHMGATIAVAQALQRAGYIKDFGYRASLPQQEALLREWDEAFRRAAQAAGEGVASRNPGVGQLATEGAAVAAGAGGLWSYANNER